MQLFPSPPQATEVRTTRFGFKKEEKLPTTYQPIGLVSNSAIAHGFLVYVG